MYNWITKWNPEEDISIYDIDIYYDNNVEVSINSTNENIIKSLNNKVSYSLKKWSSVYLFKKMRKWVLDYKINHKPLNGIYLWEMKDKYIIKLKWFTWAHWIKYFNKFDYSIQITLFTDNNNWISNISKKTINNEDFIFKFNYKKKVVITLHNSHVIYWYYWWESIEYWLKLLNVLKSDPAYSSKFSSLIETDWNTDLITLLPTSLIREIKRY